MAGMFDDLIPQGRLSRGERNNNAGNIEDGPFARSLPGYAGTDGRFARFNTADDGASAIDRLLSSYAKRGINSPEGVIGRWAPASDNNPTRNYSAYVAEGLGVAPNAQIDLNDPAVRKAVGERIAQFETGKRQAAPKASPAQSMSFDDLIPSAPAAAPQAAQEPPKAPSVGMGDAVARGVQQGVTFNFGDELRGLLAAGGGKVGSDTEPAGPHNALIGAYKLLVSGDPEARRIFDETVSKERQANKTAQEERPYSTMAGNVAGAVALPVGGLLGAATLPARVGRGAAVGAGSGALYGAGEGEGIEDRAAKAATGALIGGGVGAVAPPIMAGVGAAAGKVAEPIRNIARGLTDPEAEASRRVVTGLQRDAAAGRTGLTPQEFVAARAEGSPVANIDMGGETTRALARSAANTSPEARAALERTTSDRFGTQGDRAADFVRGLVRTPADASKTREALEDAAQKYRRPFYEKAYRDGVGGIIDDELEAMASSPVMKDALQEAAKSLQNKQASGRNVVPLSLSGKPTLEYWDQVKRSLDSQYSVLSRKGDKEAAADVLTMKNRLVDKLDKAVPSYEVARGVSSEFFKAGSALEAGEKFVRMNVGLSDAAKAIGKMSPEEKTLFREGFVSRLIQDISATGDRRNVINKIMGSQAARRKVELALGPNGTQKLEAFVRVESILDRARGAVSGNSTTARQLMEAGLAGGAYGAATGDITNPTSFLVGALAFGVRRGGMKIDQRVAQRVGEMLASNDPMVLQKGLDIISKNKGMMQALRAADSPVAKLAGQQSPGSGISLQAPAASRAEDE
jgi:hypothetical protein